MKTAVIYARFSTDLQNDRSIADQVALCRSYAARHGYTVTATYEDRALSGTSLRNRPGMQRLLAAARDRSFDALISESTSRLGRDQEDRAGIRKRLRFASIEILTPADGVVTDLTDGIRAVIDAQYIEDLRHATRRGLRSRISEGLSAGGRAYGYAVVPGAKGQRVIVLAEAEIVRRIFAEFLAGKTPRAIAHGLNADQVAPPRAGRGWNASTINGNAQRGCGILRNPLYAGRLVWNKIRMVKDPETSRRVSQPNPPAEWYSREVPDLAIVTPEIFEAAQLRKRERAHLAPAHQRRPKHILSGLLRCGACGSGMSVYGRDKAGRQRLRCSRAAESGSCPDPKTFYLDAVEDLALGTLRAELRAPDVIAEFVREYHAERRRLAAKGETDRTRMQRRLGELQREIDRLVDAVAKGLGDPAVFGPRSTALDSERRQLESALAAAPSRQVVALHPAALDRYERMVGRLHGALASPLRDDDATAALRDLVETVTVHRTPGGLQVEISGRLNALLGPQAFPNGRRSSRRISGSGDTIPPIRPPLRFQLRAAA
jgi:site-specific DNA recombinase